MAEDDPEQRELTANRFRRLIGELLRGSIARTTFQRWEIELLLDIEACALDPKRRIGTLRRYVRAVGRDVETHGGTPMKLSEFLQRSKTRRPSIE